MSFTDGSGLQLHTLASAAMKCSTCLTCTIGLTHRWAVSKTCHDCTCKILRDLKKRTGVCLGANIQLKEVLEKSGKK